MIVFKTVRWKNFFSTGAVFTEFQLDASSTTLIVGKNGNGKTTVIEAICFALFGKTLRGVNKPQIVNSINKKECVVELEFTKGTKHFKVVRGIKPNLFQIFIDGEAVDEAADVRDFQTQFETEILGFTFKAFTQIATISSVNFVPFMQLPAASRREIVEDLLDIGIFGKMNVILKERTNAIKKEISDVQSSVMVLETKIEGQQNLIAAIEKSNESKVNDLHNQLLEMVGELDKTQIELETQEVVIKQLPEIPEVSRIREERDKIMTAISTLNVKINLAKDGIAYILKNPDCPTCKRPWDKHEQNHEKEQHEQNLAKMLPLVDSLKSKLSGLDEKIKAAMTIKETHDSALQVKRRLEQTMNQLKQQGKNLERQLNEAKKPAEDSTEQKEKLSKLQDQLKETMDGLVVKKQQLSDHEVSLKLLKDDGIKTAIISKYLPVINQSVNEYLSLLDLFVSFELDETFNETIKSRHRDDFTYSSFSEGEKQRINLALLFTWRKIAKMRNNLNTNMLFMDEVLDSSTDADGVEKLIDIIAAEDDNGTNTLVISHSPETYLGRFDRVVRFEKEGNFSVMKEE